LLLGHGGGVLASEVPPACLAEFTPIGRALCLNGALQESELRVAALVRQAAAPHLGLRDQDLVAAQDHWRRYRDLHCGLRERDGESAGSEAPADIAACRLTITLQREAALRALIGAMGPR
jgi:uncharacterized protein YecT (DUF1311 family)